MLMIKYMWVDTSTSASTSTSPAEEARAIHTHRTEFEWEKGAQSVLSGVLVWCVISMSTFLFFYFFGSCPCTDGRWMGTI